MRFKYYLRGIGIGVTLATLLLTVSFYFGRDFLYYKTLSDEEIIEKATALGMVMPEGSEQSEATEMTEASQESADSQVAEETELAEEVEISADSAIEDAEVPLAEPTDLPTVENAGAESEETVSYTAFTVRAGESSETISSNLKKAGLIEDADEFNKYLHKCKVDHLIQNGTFYVKQGSEYDDLIAVLVNKDVRTTTPPKN